MIVRIVSLFATLFMLVGMATSAKADWYEASSDHFVIYADDSEKDIRKFAENLERYHSAMVYLTQAQIDKPSPSNRVVIFVVGGERDIDRLVGDKNRDVAGFYIPRAGGSSAFVQTIRNKSGYPDFSTVVLLHEYAHHFLMSDRRFVMPRWMSEGAAEFFASASFNKDGSVLIGRPAQHRAYGLAMINPPDATELLDPEVFKKNRGNNMDGFYARSWLLYHYLTFEESRRGQIRQYSIAIASGMSPREAAEAAFGDLKELERELKKYARARKMFTFNISGDRLPVGQISLRRLPEGEAEMMPVRIRSQRGVNEEEAAELLIKAREIAAKYPNDPGVLTTLAEAEYDAGNDDQAIAAADRAIALDPTRANAYVQKGYALFRKAGDADDIAAAYDAAMEPFSQLNSRETDHPLPLIYYYRSYAERGITPPENAKLALERAAQLAPFDQRLWFEVAMMQAQEGKIELAKMSLQPLAANPHGGNMQERAQRLLTSLGNATEGEPVSLMRLEFMAAPSALNGDGGSDDTDGDETGD